jgi:hypothetical protein
MFFNIKKWFLGILIFLTFTLKPFVQFKLLVNKKTGNLVYLLGDTHKIEADRINERHCKAFKANILEGTFMQPKSKINCFIEIEKEFFEAIKDNKKISEDINIGKTFFLLSEYAKKENRFLNFIPFEPREKDSGILTDLFEIINFRNMDENNFDIQNFVIKQSPNQSLFPLKRYLESIKKMSNNLKTIVSKYEKSPIKQILDEKMKIFEKSKDYIFAMFKGIDDQTFIMDAYLQIYKNNCKSYKEVLELEKKLINEMLFNINYLFAEICFFEKIITDQEINSKTMLISGVDHTDKIAAMLEKVGYEIISKQSIYITISEYIHKIEDPKGDFMKNLITATQMFLIVSTKKN